MSALTTPKRGNMGAVCVKDVFPSARPSNHISSIGLHENVDLPGSLGILEGGADGSSLGLSESGMIGSSAARPL